MRGDSGVAGEGRVIGILKFPSWGKCTINEYQLMLDVQCFLWPVYYIVRLIIYAGPLSYILECNYLYYTGPLSCILGCK